LLASIISDYECNLDLSKDAMGSAAILLAELENAVSRGSHSRRTQMLRMPG